MAVTQVEGTKEGLFSIMQGDTTLASVTGNNDGGFISFRDKYGEPEVQLYVNENGDGVVFR
jgi:hypothetical protein